MKILLLLLLTLACSRTLERSVAQLPIEILTDEAAIAHCEAINTFAPVGCPNAVKSGCEHCLDEISSQASTLGANTILVSSKDTAMCAKQEITAVLFRCQKSP